MNFLAILVCIALAFGGCVLPESCETAQVCALNNLHITVNGENIDGLPDAEFRIGLSRSEAFAKLNLLENGEAFLPFAIDVADQKVRFALGAENYYSIESKLLTELVTGGNAADNIAVTERMLDDMIDLIKEVREKGVAVFEEFTDFETLSEIFDVTTGETFVTFNGEQLPATQTDFAVTIGSLVDFLDLCEKQGGAFKSVSLDILELAGGPALGIDSFEALKAALPEVSAAIGVKGIITVANEADYSSFTLSYESSDGSSITFETEYGNGATMLHFATSEGALGTGYDAQLNIHNDNTLELACEQTEDGQTSATLDAEGAFEAGDDGLSAITFKGEFDIPCLSMRYEAGEAGSYAYVTDAVSGSFGYDIAVTDGLSDLTYTAEVDMSTITERFDENGDAVGEPETVSQTVSEVETVSQRIDDDGSIASDFELNASLPGIELNYGGTLTVREESATDLFEGMTEYVFGTEDSNDETMTALGADLEALIGEISSLAARFVPAEAVETAEIVAEQE